MSDTTKVTVQFVGTITYDAPPANCEGTPYPTTPDGHAEAMAGDILGALNDHLAFDEEDLEPTDYVQTIHELTVTGLTEAETKRLARLEELAVRARKLTDGFQDAVAPLTDSEGDPRQGCVGQYDSVTGDYEADAWPLVQLLATFAKGE